MNKPEIIRNTEPPKKRMSKEALARQIEKMRERDAEMVTGVFKNLENPASNGGRGAVAFGFKAYPNDDFVFYELLDGERYTIPRGVARHLNNDCYFKEYQHLPHESGVTGVRQAMDGRLQSATMQISRKVHRYAFHSLEYMDDDPVDLVEVTVSP